MKDAVVKTYGHKGESIVNMNCEAIDAGLNALRKIEIPEEWKTAKDKKAKVQIDTDRPDLAAFVEKVMIPANAMRGDEIPVSVMKEVCPGGTLPQGTSQFERRGIAVDVPHLGAPSLHPVQPLRDGVPAWCAPFLCRQC